MKTLIITLFLFLITPLVCLADDFQIFIGHGSQRIRADYAVVTMTDGNNQIVINNKYADAYGRIKLDARLGSYVCKVVHKGKTYTVRISIDGNAHLKGLIINP